MKYEDLLQSATLDGREVFINPETDVFVPSAFIENYRQTYKEELEWANDYIQLKTEIESLEEEIPTEALLKQIESKKAALSRREANYLNDNGTFRKDNACLKHFTVMVLEDYFCNKEQDFKIIVFGRLHGKDLPFFYQDGRARYVSRMQWALALSNSSCFAIDLGSHEGTAGKSKVSRKLTSKEVEEAAQQSSRTADTLLDTFKTLSSQKAHEEYAEKAINTMKEKRKNILNNYSFSTALEANFSTTTKDSLGILPISSTGTFCVKMGRIHHSRSMTLELVLQEGRLEKVFAITKDEYESLAPLYVEPGLVGNTTSPTSNATTSAYIEYAVFQREEDTQVFEDSSSILQLTNNCT